jgi:AAA15 family ATPase/GTPase
MILNYSVKNFYSIGEDGASVNFAVNGNAPKTDLYINAGDIAGRISLVETVIGANASGKTQLLKGLAFISYLITQSYRQDPSGPMLFESHMGLTDVPSEVSVSFVIDGRVFEYALEFNTKKILKEELKELSKTNERVTAKTVSSRKWNDKDGRYTYKDSALGINSANELRRNASMINSAMQKDSPADLAQMIFGYWSDRVVVHNLWLGGNREDNDAGDRLLQDKLKELLDKSNETLKDQVKEILQKYDIGFDDFFEQIVKLPNNENLSIYYIAHKFKGSDFLIKLPMESSGTKRLISTLTSIVGTLLTENGGIAVIDEIDAFLHPDIVEALVDLFVYPETNPNHAQLLFSTHNHRLLESFDKQQITLTDKTDEGKTESWRLDEVEGVKSTDNYYTKYITGAYGARPKIGA